MSETLTGSLVGKVAIVTGAGGGLGAAFARALTQAGAKVLLTDRDEAKLQALARDLGAAHLACDMTEDGVPARLVQHAVDTHQRLDIVLNNAGMMVVGPADELDDAKMTAMVRLNVEAAFRMGYAAIRHFRQTRGGHLINTSSVAGIHFGPTLSAYSGSKAAIEAFTESLRLELAGTDIAVACIEPGSVDTGLFDKMSDADKKKFTEGALKPEDVAEAALFILIRPRHVRVPRILITPAGQAA